MYRVARPDAVRVRKDSPLSLCTSRIVSRRQLRPFRCTVSLVQLPRSSPLVTQTRGAGWKADRNRRTHAQGGRSTVPVSVHGLSTEMDTTYTAVTRTTECLRLARSAVTSHDIHGVGEKFQVGCMYVRTTDPARKWKGEAEHRQAAPDPTKDAKMFKMGYSRQGLTL